jgi:mycothiol synthase
VGEIYVLAVAPAHQGQGLGKALLLDGLAHLSRAKANAAVLYVDSGNDRATRLYESVGFRLDHVDRSFVRLL